MPVGRVIAFEASDIVVVGVVVEFARGMIVAEATVCVPS